MDRRAFITALAGGLLAAPLAAEAQEARRVWRLGFLGDGVAAARAAHTLEPLREGLRELGYVEGRNLSIDARWSEGHTGRLAGIAAEFVRLGVDVIVSHGVPGSRAAKAATSTTPIVVAAAADMVGVGLVTSLARPGGNVTGISDQASEVSVKEVELLAELLPGLQSVALLWNRTNPAAMRTSNTLQIAARDRGLRIVPLEVTQVDEIETSIDRASAARVDAVVVVHDAMILNHRTRIAQLALKKRLPTISAATVFAEAGGLMSYGPDLAGLCKRAAVFVDKILKGAKPGDLPVEQPTKFELVINLKTAKALGLTIPPSLLQRADQVID